MISKLKEAMNIDKHTSVEEINKNLQEQSNKPVKRKIIPIGVTVKGLNNIMVRYAKCCSPVAGDEIVGYITKGRGISVHRKDCSNIKNLPIEEKHKLVEVNWGSYQGEEYISEIQVKSEDRGGLLTEIMTIISESNFHLQALSAKTSKNNVASINIKLRINSIDQLRDLMKKIRRLSGVMEVFRVHN